VLRALLYSVLGTPSSKPRSWRWGDFKYVIVDGKYVKLRGGRRGVLLIALGLTDHGVRAVLDVVLTGEEDVVSYWDLPVRLWRYNLTLVVADGLRPWRKPSPAPGSRSRGRPAWSTSNEAGG